MSAPSPDLHGTSGYRCGLCGDTAIAPGKCERCNVEYVHADGSVRLTTQRTRGAYLPRSGALVIGITAMVLYLSPFWLWLGRSVLEAALGASLSVFVLWVLYAGLRQSAETRRIRAELQRFPDDVPARAIADAPEGRVRLVGRVVRDRAILTVGERACVAVARERRIEADRVNTLVDFRVVDDHGNTAVVRTSRINVTHGVAVGEATVIPEGARVELVGVARLATKLPDGTDGFRAMAHELEIAGTAAEPVVLRVIDDDRASAPTGEPTSGVRVDARADRDTHEQGATAEERARATRV